MVDFLHKAGEFGIPHDRIWVDPIVTPVNVDINQVKACFEFISMVKEIAPEARTVCGLSNVSNGVPAHLRPWINRTYLIMMIKGGLGAAIVDAFDDTITEIAAGGKAGIVEIVSRVAAGERIDPSTLDDEETKYYKTARVLMGETVYSDSWLEI